ncbi:MAG: hypothetical protein ACI8RA_001162 [Chlamydiales bacterium]|jgi:hypothetical protein
MKQKTMGIVIPRRAGACLKCGESMEESVEYYSILDSSEDYPQRFDYCIPCWGKGAKAESAGDSRTYWKSKVPLKKTRQEVTLTKDEKALELLEELVSSVQSEDANLAFVLALYLVRRKKIVKRKDVKEVTIYEVLETEEIIAVKKVDVTVLPIVDIQKQIDLKLC